MLESEVFDPGEPIISQGEMGNYFYILEEGEAKAYVGGEYDEVEASTLVRLRLFSLHPERLQCVPVAVAAARYL